MLTFSIRTLPTPKGYIWQRFTFHEGELVTLERSLDYYPTAAHAWKAAL